MTISKWRVLCLILSILFFAPLPSYAEKLPIYVLMGNLDQAAAASAVPSQVSNVTLNQASEFSTVITVEDRKGAEHTLSLFFIKTTKANSSTVWKVVVAAQTSELRGVTGGDATILATRPLRASTLGAPVSGRANLSVRWRGTKNPSTYVVLVSMTELAASSNLSAIQSF